MENIGEAGSSKESSEHNEENSFLMEISQEIYELLLSHISTSYTELDEIEIQFTELKKCHAHKAKIKKNINEQPVYHQEIIVNPKKQYKKAKLMLMDDIKREESDLKLQFLDHLRDINIAKIWIQSIEINVDILTQSNHTLKDLKLMTLKNLESIYKESFTTFDLEIFSFAFKNIEIPKVDEELSLGVMISKNNLEESLIGNILNIDMKICDKKIELDIVKTILLKNKEINEKLKILIKFEKPNYKLSKRILIVREDNADYIYVLITKSKEDYQMVFPISSIKNIEKVPFKREANQDADDIRIKITFVEDLKWADLYFFFLNEKQYLLFLEIFLEDRAKRKKNPLSHKITTGVIPYDDITKLSHKKDENKMIESMTLEEILEQTKDINMVLDHIEEKEHKYIEEEMKKYDEGSKFEEQTEKIFNIKMKNMLNIKSDRILKCTTNYDIEILKPAKTHKGIYTYSVSEIDNVSLKQLNKPKVLLNFKNKKTKSIKLYFNSLEDANGFIVYYNNTLVENFSKFNTGTHNKNLFKKDIKRYSWLCQQNVYNINKMKDIKDKFYSGKVVDIHFNVINKMKQGDQKQILHINFINNIITLLKPNQDLVKQLSIKKITSLSNSYDDSRKVLMNFKKRSVIDKSKTLEFIFQDNKAKYLFYSSYYSMLYPELKEIPKPKFNIYITSWNVGFSEPPNEITFFFLKNFEDCDLVAIGLQECKYNSWIERFQTKMKIYKFSLLTVVTMWRMMLCVFIKTVHLEKVCHLEVVSKPTGIANLIGNKGGLLTSFSINETSFCFISSHLAAKPNHVELRKNNYYDLIKNMRTGVKELETVFQFDYVFWCGDLNFRIDYPFDKVAELCQTESYDSLQEYDQLTKERNENNIFSDFNEGQLNFRPTYRRIRNDDTWSNKKNQSPSWCDRVLFRAKPNYHIELLEYGSREQQYGSDHRPVFAKFETELQVPYIGNPPLHLRKKNPDGYIRINKINLEYDLKAMTNLNEFLPINFPFEMIITFSGDFLKNITSTLPMKIDKYIDSFSVVWEKDQIPMLHSVISDFKFLKYQSVILSITANDRENNEILIGQAYLSLNEIIENNGARTDFDCNACLFGKIIGVLQGSVEYDIEHAEVFIL